MSESSNCWHCGEALTEGGVVHARVAGVARSMCCQGCKAAAEWIEQLGLADYYALRTAPAQKPVVADTATHDAWAGADNARQFIAALEGILAEPVVTERPI